MKMVGVGIKRWEECKRYHRRELTVFWLRGKVKKIPVLYVRG